MSINHVIDPLANPKYNIYCNDINADGDVGIGGGLGVVGNVVCANLTAGASISATNAFIDNKLVYNITAPLFASDSSSKRLFINNTPPSPADKITLGENLDILALNSWTMRKCEATEYYDNNTLTSARYETYELSLTAEVRPPAVLQNNTYFTLLFNMSAYSSNFDCITNVGSALSNQTTFTNGVLNTQTLNTNQIGSNLSIYYEVFNQSVALPVCNYICSNVIKIVCFDKPLV